MVNRKKCYVVLSTAGSDSKTVSFRLPSDYPLSGDSVKLLIEEVDLTKKSHSEEYNQVVLSITEYMKAKRDGISNKGNGQSIENDTDVA